MKLDVFYAYLGTCLVIRTGEEMKILFFKGGIRRKRR